MIETLKEEMTFVDLKFSQNRKIIFQSVQHQRFFQIKKNHKRRNENIKRVLELYFQKDKSRDLLKRTLKHQRKGSLLFLLQRFKSSLLDCVR